MLKKIILKKYFILYRPFLLFLGTFFGIYLVLTFFYQMYLNQFDTPKREVDYFTEIVTQQSVFVISFLDKNSHATANTNDPSVKLFYKNKNVSKVIEGCNALSIIILFVSFVIAFSGKWKQTFLFVFFGSLIIHICNVLRIALLSVLFYEFPKYKNVLHGVIFPFLIYGVVFALWIIWANKFSNYAEKTNTQ